MIIRVREQQFVFVSKTNPKLCCRFLDINCNWSIPVIKKYIVCFHNMEQQFIHTKPVSYLNTEHLLQIPTVYFDQLYDKYDIYSSIS